MRQTLPDHRAARGLAVAAAGLFAGHVLIYRLVAPSALERAILLARTGHSYLPPAVVVGAAGAALAAIAAFVLGVRRGVSPHPSAQSPGCRLGLVRALAAPALAQATAFVALELLERALAGAPLGGLLGPLLPVGILLQLVVGTLGGLVLAGLDRAGEGVGRSLAARRRAPRRRTVPRHPPVPARPFARLDRAGSLGIRGPPLPA
jgi:hypothetical protein